MALEYGGLPFLQMLLTYKATAKVPIYLHFDHFSHRKDLERVFSMLSELYKLNGDNKKFRFDSMMVDGSHLSIDENLSLTAEMVINFA